MPWRYAFLGFVFLAAPVAQAQDAPAPPGREHLLMDAGWRFALGNAADPKLDYGFGTFWSWLAKQDIQPGALGTTFDDSKWRTVDLPHDWGMELPYDSKTTGAWGFRPIGRGFPATSIGWYRKTFDVPVSDYGRRISLEFEGVCRDCVVAVNGIYVGSHASAYTSFSFDITDMIHFGGKNLVVVRVDAQQNEGWWYQGAGIDRHVWLTKTAPVHLPLWGTQVISTVADGTAQIAAHTELANDSDAAADVTVESTILGPDGQSVATDTQPAQHLEPWTHGSLAPTLNVATPKLWSPDTPALYRLVTVLKVNGTETDRAETPFGIRTAVFDPDRGFLLNGQPVKIQGVCEHQQHAFVGTGVPDALWDYHIKKLKEMGCNAIRMSHNPAPPAFLEACDRLGIMVLAEQRLFSSSEEGLAQLTSMVRRDRNHPSIILWSAGNEEYGDGMQSGATGAAIIKTLQDTFHRLDPTRQVTFAASNGGVTTGVNSVADVRGVNYLILFDNKLTMKSDRSLPHDATPEEYHLHHPHQPIIGTEETALADEAQPAGYKNQGREPHWNFIASHPWFSGAFIWTGFNYYGEDTWPNIAAKYALMDLCGVPRGGYWYFQQAWTGRASSPPAKGGPATAITFHPDRASIPADGRDVDVIDLDLLDAHQNVATGAENPLTITLSGPGKIVGMGNGWEKSRQLNIGDKREAHDGHAQVLVESTRTPGTIQITVTSPGLPSSSITVTTTACTPPPSVP